MTLFEAAFTLLKTPSRWLLSVENVDLAVLGGLSAAMVALNPGTASPITFFVTFLAVSWVVSRLLYRWYRAQSDDRGAIKGNRAAYYIFGVFYLLVFLSSDFGVLTFEQREVALNFTPILALVLAVLARMSVLGPLISFRKVPYA